MIFPKYQDLFKKEPKKIILTIGIFYVIIGVWALIVAYLQKSMMNSVQEDQEFSAFNNTMELLHSIWIIYMPILALIGIGMILFSYAIGRLRKQRIAIQITILVVCVIWVIAYTYSCIPYMKAFQSISPQQKTFNVIAYVFAFFGFAAVFAFMTIPNYRILKKLQAEKNRM